MDIVGWLGIVGLFLSVSAAWGGLWSPRARRLKDERKAKELRDQKVHDALFGDDILYPGGMIADLRAMKLKLDAPLLNGKGDALITTVARIDKRVEALGRRTTAIERRLKTEAGK